MTIGRPTTSTWPLVGAGNIQASAGPTRWSTVITLDREEISGLTIASKEDSSGYLYFTNTAGIAGLAQPRFVVHPVKQGVADMTRLGEC